MPKKQLSPGAALVAARWANTTADERSALASKLGKARAKKLSPARRKEIATKASAAAALARQKKV